MTPLQTALQILEDTDPDNDGEAVDRMLAFVREVEARRETLTEERADELVAEAQRIIALLVLP